MTPAEGALRNLVSNANSVNRNRNNCQAIQVWSRLGSAKQHQHLAGYAPRVPIVAAVAVEMQHFANKHVLITGGSEGLGLALAKQLVAQGARVSLVARTKSKLEAAATAVTAGNQSSQVSCHPADVTKYQEVCGLERCSSSHTFGLFS